MDRRPLKTRSQAWVPVVAMALVRLGLKPNHVSVLSIGCAAIAGLAFWRRWHPILLLVAAAGIQLRLLCNLLDGVMAVEAGLKSKTGDLYNDIPDRLADVAILVGAGYGVGHPTLGWIAGLLAVMTAYLRLLGGALGFPQDFSGPCAKPHRMFWMTVGALLGFVDALVAHHHFAVLIALTWVAIGTAITCVRRTLRLVRAMEAR
jgi:phosphatidylglycerophosphate synthase